MLGGGEPREVARGERQRRAVRAARPPDRRRPRLPEGGARTRAERRGRPGPRLLAAHIRRRRGRDRPVDHHWRRSLRHRRRAGRGRAAARRCSRRPVPSEADVYLPIEYDEAFSATRRRSGARTILAVLARARAEAPPALIDEDLRRIGQRAADGLSADERGLTMNAISARDLHRRRRAKAAAGVARRGGLRSAHRVRQRREPDARTGVGATGRAGGSNGARRPARAAGAPAADRGDRARPRGWRARPGARVPATTALVAAEPADIPRLEEIRLDRTVVLFTLAVSLLASLVFGALPALQATGGSRPGCALAVAAAPPTGTRSACGPA